MVFRCTPHTVWELVGFMLLHTTCVSVYWFTVVKTLPFSICEEIQSGIAIHSNILVDGCHHLGLWGFEPKVGPANCAECRICLLIRISWTPVCPQTMPYVSKHLDMWCEIHYSPLWAFNWIFAIYVHVPASCMRLFWSLLFWSLLLWSVFYGVHWFHSRLTLLTW